MEIVQYPYFMFILKLVVNLDSIKSTIKCMYYVCTPKDEKSRLKKRRTQDRGLIVLYFHMAVAIGNSLCKYTK